MLISLHRTRPAKFVGVLAVLCIIWFWLADVRDISLNDDPFPASTPLDEEKAAAAPPAVSLADAGPSAGNSFAAVLPAASSSAAASHPAATPSASPVAPPAAEASSADPSSRKQSRIGKVTVAANKLDADVIHRAMKTHERHNERHGYVHHIAVNQAVSPLTENDHSKRPGGAWTKPAYLLSILVVELQKPEDERLQWV